ncbi:MAG: toll/interleukin-1 receptor domain-containing protein [Bacteroidales bacterium]|nr:toll/interleukin-1 receptor domain-containing protein [Bacteroidales bacterium]
MKEYINKDNPVYFSYAWGDELEEDVNKLCELMDENGIFFKRDKAKGENSLCPYRWSINEAEKEIGAGTAIIVVISNKYIKSPHCMHEWHSIRENGNIQERVFPIVLEDANITDKEVFKKYYEFFEKRKQELLKQQAEDIIPTNQVDLDTIDAGYFIDDFKKLYKYLSNYNRSKISLLREDNYEDIIGQLKEKVKGDSKKYNGNINVSAVPYGNATATPHFKFYVPDGLIIEIRKVEHEDNS